MFPCFSKYYLHHNLFWGVKNWDCNPACRAQFSTTPMSPTPALERECSIPAVDPEVYVSCLLPGSNRTDLVAVTLPSSETRF